MRCVFQCTESCSTLMTKLCSLEEPLEGSVFVIYCYTLNDACTGGECLFGYTLECLCGYTLNDACTGGECLCGYSLEFLCGYTLNDACRLHKKNPWDELLCVSVHRVMVSVDPKMQKIHLQTCLLKLRE